MNSTGLSKLQPSKPTRIVDAAPSWPMLASASPPPVEAVSSETSFNRLPVGCRQCGSRTAGRRLAVHLRPLEMDAGRAPMGPYIGDPKESRNPEQGQRLRGERLRSPRSGIIQKAGKSPIALHRRRVSRYSGYLSKLGDQWATPGLTIPSLGLAPPAAPESPGLSIVVSAAARGGSGRV